jgi:gliding motility-associated protein GldL
MKPGSKRWKQFMAKLYGIGAAVVIIGALFKIEHWAGASLFLTVGLLTEAVIFFFSAFEPPHEEPDWSLVYPELASGDRKEGSRNDGRSLTEQLDDMLIEAKIEPELIQSLGDGMRNLSTSAQNMGDLTESGVASKELSENLRGASQKISDLSHSYEEASASLTGIKEHAEAGMQTGDSLRKMSDNLNSLNNMYELQLQELEKSRQLYAGMTTLVENLNESIDGTRKYKENIAELAHNLESLNTVYSNMLNAMGSGSRS